MEQFDFKAYSELIGLIPPDDIEPDVYLPFDYSACGCVVCEQHKHIKLPGQSLVELELASRPHRWKKMREIQKNFYNAMAEEVVKAEIDLLKLLKLPDIDTIRQAEAGEDVSARGKFEYTAKMKLGHERIVQDLQEALVGDREIVKSEKKSFFHLPHKKIINPGLENSIFGYFMRSALGEALEQVYRQLIMNLPEGMTEADIDKSRVLPQLANEVFAAAVNIGATRIRIKLSEKNLAALKEALKDMAKSGDNPMVVGRYLHKNFGELALWEWNRIARSESALMVNAAFDVQSRAAGVKYEKWSSAINACPICLAFDGRVWDLMSGPQPVECVPGDCRVVTQSGIKQIKDVRFGESVLSHNERFCKVTKIYRHDSFNQEMIKVFWTNENGNESSLELSPNHPVYIDSKWIDSGLLEVGNNLSVLPEKSWKFRFAPITRIEKTVYSWIELYNLHVEQDESYIAENVKVHNSTHPHCTLYHAKITTPDGLKFIRDIQVGDLVLTHSGRFMPVTVKHEHQELTATMVRIVAGNTMLDITDNHPVLICSGDSFVWVSAEKLKPGDQIVRGNRHGMAPVKIDGIEKYRLENVWLYNLTVAEDESYFAESVLVHNCLCIRIPLYNYTGPVQNPWTRTNPYDLRYSPDEIAGLPAYLNGERRPGTGLVPPTVVPPLTPPVPVQAQPDKPVDVEKTIREKENEIKKLSDFERGYAFNDKGEIVLRKDGGKSEVVFTDEEIKKLKDCILIHNHPSGRSFSFDDILLVTTHDLKGIRAIGVAHDFRYIIERPKNGWNVTQKQIIDFYKKENKKLRDEFELKIMKGEITIDYADLNHSHIIWEKFAKKFKLVYKKEKI